MTDEHYERIVRELKGDQSDADALRAAQAAQAKLQAQVVELLEQTIAAQRETIKMQRRRLAHFQALAAQPSEAPLDV